MGGGLFPKKRSFSLPIFLLILSGVEGVAAAAWAFNSPSDLKNSFFLSFSREKLALFLIILLISACAFVTARLLAGGNQKFTKALNLFRSSFRIRLVSYILACLVAAVCWWVYFWPPVFLIEGAAAIVEKSLPLLAWVFLGSLQFMTASIWVECRKKDILLAEKGAILTLAGLFDALLVVFLVLLVWFWPAQIGLSFRFQFVNIVIPALIVFYLLALQKSVFGRITLAFSTLVLFLLPVLGLWFSGRSEPEILFGLLPNNDAMGYYHGATRILEGGYMTEFPARRPVFSGFLALLLWIGGENLQVTILLMVCFSAAMVWWLASKVNAIFGPLPAAMTIVFIFLFYRNLSGSTMTENLGLPLGALAAALLLSGVADRWLAGYLAGMATLSLALNSRAGPFFILPLLALYGIWFFRRDRHILLTVFLFLCTIASGFIINGLVFSATAQPGAVLFGNFIHTLYGAVAGGLGWEQIYRDHPQLLALPAGEMNKEAFRITFELFKNNPSGLLEGIRVAIRDFISTNWSGIFGYIGIRNETSAVAARWICLLLSAVTIFYGLLKRANPANRMILWGFAGILASIPLVPPADGAPRTYAAIIPFLALLPAAGVQLVLGTQQPVENSRSGRRALHIPGLVLSCLVSLLILAGPVVIVKTAAAPLWQTPACPSGLSPAMIRIKSGSFIRVDRDENLPQTRLPDLTGSDFNRSLHDFMDTRLLVELEHLQPPASIVATYNLVDQAFIMAIIHEKLTPDSSGILRLCGRFSQNPQAAGIFYAETVVK